MGSERKTEKGEKTDTSQVHINVDSRETMEKVWLVRNRFANCDECDEVIDMGLTRFGFGHCEKPVTLI